MIKNNNHDEKNISFAIVMATAIFILLFFFYTPIFEANDDLGLSMIAHGYGAAFKPSANIIFSNVIYGWIISHLPIISGIYPYSYMTLFALFIVAISLLYFLDALKVHRIYSTVLLLMILVRAVAMPEFTVNAGLLALAAVAGLLTYQKSNKKIHLFLAFSLAFYSFLIRDHAFYLIIIVSSPLWIDKRLLNRKFVFFSFCFFILCIFAYLINISAYSGAEFINYNAFAKVRVPFTDFHAATYFLERPEILTQYGYTENDMKLIANFIFADNNLVNSNRLHLLLTHFKFNDRIEDNYTLALQGIKSLYDPTLRVLVFASLILILAGRNKFRFILSWIVFVIITALLGLMGRPSILRVYYPVMARLTFLPIIYIDVSQKVLLLVLFVLLGLTLTENYSINQKRILRAQSAYKDILKLAPNKIYFVLGDALPYEYIDLPTRAFPPGYKLYAFSWGYYLPGTISNQYAFGEHSFSNLLKNGHSLQLITGTNNEDIMMINEYCKEHFKRRLNIINIQEFTTFNVYTIQCNSVIR